MYIALAQERIRLPRSSDCAAFSAEARVLFQAGARSWKSVIVPAALALQHFHNVSGHPAAVWMADQPWTDSEGRPGSLITLYFSTDATLTRDDLAALGTPILKANMGWSADGVHPLPASAFPCLAYWRDELHQVWADGEDGAPPTYLSLTAKGGRARRVETAFGEADPKDFVAHVAHAVARFDAQDSAEIHHKDQLKMAFALKVAERVVEADGVVEADELAFLAKTFPVEDVERMWLDDTALRDTLARQAESELKDLLGYHEKLALLSTFFAACYSDGKLEVRELKVLKEASKALGLENSDVVSYLQRLW